MMSFAWLNEQNWPTLKHSFRSLPLKGSMNRFRQVFQLFSILGFQATELVGPPAVRGSVT
jgi:hypothetical protein